MLSPRGATIGDGDVVLLFIGHNDLKPLVVKSGEIHCCKAGRFPHDRMIGRAFGTRVEGESYDRNARVKPKMLLLQPTADLWSAAVPHRTQIIYATDIATITMMLRLGPGAVVAEAGTGSGSLTHALARAVAPVGRVYTFDFHRGRAIEARTELSRNGLSEIVVSGWRDVCSSSLDGEGLTGLEDATDNDNKVSDNNNNNNNGDGSGAANATANATAAAAPLPGFGLSAASVDAVFLDVPAPWSAIDNVMHVLKPNGILCTFSPCVEQTQRTCEALRTDPNAFVDVRTVEALTKQYEPCIKRRTIEVPASAAAAILAGDALPPMGAIPCSTSCVPPAAVTASAANDGGVDVDVVGGDNGDEATASEAKAEAKQAVAPGTVQVREQLVLLRPAAGSKGHSAYLTFARRRVPPVVPDEATAE